MMMNDEDIEVFDKNDATKKLIKNALLCLWHCVTLISSANMFFKFINSGGDSDLLFQMFLCLCINPVSIKTAIKIFNVGSVIANLLISDLLVLIGYLFAFVTAVVFGGMVGVPFIIIDLVKRVAGLPKLATKMKDKNFM